MKGRLFFKKPHLLKVCSRRNSCSVSPITAPGSALLSRSFFSSRAAGIFRDTQIDQRRWTDLLSVQSQGVFAVSAAMAARETVLTMDVVLGLSLK